MSRPGSDNWGAGLARAINKGVFGVLALFALTLLVAAAAMWRGRVRRERLRRVDEAVLATSADRARPADGEPPWTPDDDVWDEAHESPKERR